MMQKAHSIVERTTEAKKNNAGKTNVRLGSSQRMCVVMLHSIAKGHSRHVALLVRHILQIEAVTAATAVTALMVAMQKGVAYQ